MTAGALHKIDDLFCDFIRRQFRLPPKTCRRGILMQFGRRCACCDARFLATVQVARGMTNPHSVWGKVVRTVWSRSTVPWVREVKSHMRAMGIESLVMNNPASFLGERKEWGVHFSRWCHEQHHMFANGSSADMFRMERPFGLFPVVYDLPVEKSRILLIFVLSSWRWALNLRDFPHYCCDCDSMVNSWHLMFNCSQTEQIREEFRNRTGKLFSYEVLRDHSVNHEVVRALNSVIRKMREMIN